MSDLFPDKLVIQALGFGPAMTARQSIERARKILLDLETLSPWHRPFEVSGCTKETGDMPISEDLSDFEEVVMRALHSYDDVRYFNKDNAEDWTLNLDSYSPYGFRESFTNAPSAENYGSRVSVRLQASGLVDGASRDNGIDVIAIPFYEPSQSNAAWADPPVVSRLFEYFIDNFNPLKCVVFGSEQAVRISNPNCDYTLGWLNYTRNPVVAGVFMKTGKAIPYRGGVLLKLGDDASVVTDRKAEAEMIEIARMLTSVGVTR
ncbi:MAG: hypothetical protein WAK01_11850 [Methylocystis sp.]